MSAATTFAIRMVRAWTRLYTCGLPPLQRQSRQAEIDSDLWELQHDRAARLRGPVALQILTRLLNGITDDLAWRIEASTARQVVTVSALAAAGMVIGPRRVSALGLSATLHVIGLAAFVWLTSHGFLYWRNPAAAVPEEADLWEQFAAYEVGSQDVAAPSPEMESPPPSHPNRFIARLLQNRYSLEVGNGYLFGPGAQVLQAAVRDSHFVLLGEERDLAGISNLGQAICSTTLRQCESLIMRVDPMQVYRGINPAGGRGTGSDVAIRAERAGLRSLHIRVITAAASDDAALPRPLRLFVSKRLSEGSTLFDLRPLRRDFNALAGRRNADLATLVFGIDMLVVIPER